MPAKIEKKDVTYAHEIDGKHGSRMDIPRTVSTEPVESIPDVAVQNKNRLEIEYNVGKRPETKNVQGLK